jgi:hypothetical protein
MAARLKTTGFTRFLLMLIIVLPLAYIGASYYNGEDPVANIKSLFNKEAPANTQEAEVPATAEDVSTPTALEACKRENELLTKRIADLEALLEQSENQ